MQEMRRESYKKTNSTMTDVSPSLSVITLYVNGLIFLIKRQIDRMDKNTCSNYTLSARDLL